MHRAALIFSLCFVSTVASAKKDRDWTIEIEATGPTNQVKHFRLATSKTLEQGLLEIGSKYTACRVDFAEGRDYVELGCLPSVWTETQMRRITTRVPCGVAKPTWLTVYEGMKDGGTFSFAAVCH
jgi:hypothetical protein